MICVKDTASSGIGIAQRTSGMISLTIALTNEQTNPVPVLFSDKQFGTKYNIIVLSLYMFYYYRIILLMNVTECKNYLSKGIQCAYCSIAIVSNYYIELCQRNCSLHNATKTQWFWRFHGPVTIK